MSDEEYDRNAKTCEVLVEKIGEVLVGYTIADALVAIIEVAGIVAAKHYSTCLCDADHYTDVAEFIKKSCEHYASRQHPSAQA